MRFIIIAAIVCLGACKTISQKPPETSSLDFAKQNIDSGFQSKALQRGKAQVSRILEGAASQIKDTICDLKGNSSIDAISTRVDMNISKGPMLFSAGSEVSFWFHPQDPEKIIVQIYAIPEVSISKERSGVRASLNLVYGCDGSYSNYKGAFLFGGIQGLTLSLGFDQQAAIYDAYDKVYKYLELEPDYIKGSASSAKAYSMLELGEKFEASLKKISSLAELIKQANPKFNTRAYKGIFIPTQVGNLKEQVSLYEILDVSKDIYKKEFYREEATGAYKSKTNGYVKKIHSGGQDLDPTLKFYIAKNLLAHLFDEKTDGNKNLFSASMRHKIATIALTFAHLNRDYGNLLLNEVPVSTGSLFNIGILSARNVEELKTSMTNSNISCSILIKQSPGTRFFTVMIGDKPAYLDCVAGTQKVGTFTSVYNEREFSVLSKQLQSFRKLVDEYDSLNYYARQINYRTLDYLNGHSVDITRKPQSSSYLSGCNSLGYSISGNIFKPKSADIGSIKTASINSNKAMNVLAGVGYSYFYELPTSIFKPFEINIDDIPGLSAISKVRSLECK